MDIANTYPAESRRLRVLLTLTTLLLGVGLVAPVVTLNKFVLVENTFSVVGGVVELLKEGKFFLFFVITIFSIVVPLLKIGVLYRLLGRGAGGAGHVQKCLHWMHLYGRWSMLDVFVVAVLVVTVKLGAVANVEVEPGLYAFATAVIGTMYITGRTVSLASRAIPEPA